MKTAFTSFVCMIALIIPWGFANRANAVTVVKSSAAARVWVPSDQEKLFVGELREYSRDKGLTFYSAKPPLDVWTTSGVRLLTPKENRISIIMTVLGKFSAAIVVLHPEEN